MEKKCPFSADFVLTPKDASGPLPWVYYSHGGCLLVDLLPAHVDRCSEYARRIGCTVVLPSWVPAR